MRGAVACASCEVMRTRGRPVVCSRRPPHAALPDCHRLPVVGRFRFPTTARRPAAVRSGDPTWSQKVAHGVSTYCIYTTKCTEPVDAGLVAEGAGVAFHLDPQVADMTSVPGHSAVAHAEIVAAGSRCPIARRWREMEALGSDAVEVPNGVDVDSFASAARLDGYPRQGKVFLGRYDEPGAWPFYRRYRKVCSGSGCPADRRPRRRPLRGQAGRLACAFWVRWTTPELRRCAAPTSTVRPAPAVRISALCWSAAGARWPATSAPSGIDDGEGRAPGAGGPAELADRVGRWTDCGGERCPAEAMRRPAARGRPLRMTLVVVASRIMRVCRRSPGQAPRFQVAR